MHDTSEKTRAVTFTASTNARSLYQSAKALGVPFATVDPSGCLGVPTTKCLSSQDWLMFTEENSLEKALRGELSGHFHPRSFPLHLLDDKYAFAEFLKKETGLTLCVPHWSLANKDQVSFPCLVKAKKSWFEGSRVPRGWVCRSKKELEERLDTLRQGSIPLDCFFLQAWFGDKGQCEVLSVCGFHDADEANRNLTAVVRRVASAQAGLSCSAMVETVKDQWELRNRTRKILDALAFVGPFELEFLLVGSQVHVLELNPRFWMQHEIFFKKGNGVVKRYLGLDAPSDRETQQIEDVAWVDGIQLLMSLGTFDLRFLYLVLRRSFDPRIQVVLTPSLKQSARKWVEIFRNKPKPWRAVLRRFRETRLAK